MPHNSAHQALQLGVVRSALATVGLQVLLAPSQAVQVIQLLHKGLLVVQHQFAQVIVRLLAHPAYDLPYGTSSDDHCQRMCVHNDTVVVSDLP